MQDIGFFPASKLKSHWLDNNKTSAQRAVDKNNFCRALNNDLPYVPNYVRPKCKINGIAKECTISTCDYTKCPVGYRSCNTGECIPEYNFCDRIPHCPLRDDEADCAVEYLTRPLEFATVGGNTSHSFLSLLPNNFENRVFLLFMPTDIAWKDSEIILDISVSSKMTKSDIVFNGPINEIPSITGQLIKLLVKK